MQSRMWEPSGPADAAPSSALSFLTGQTGPPRRFRDYCDCGVSPEQARRDHFARAACGPIGEVVSSEASIAQCTTFLELLGPSYASQSQIVNPSVGER